MAQSTVWAGKVVQFGKQRTPQRHLSTVSPLSHSSPASWPNIKQGQNQRGNHRLHTQKFFLLSFGCLWSAQLRSAWLPPVRGRYLAAVKPRAHQVSSNTSPPLTTPSYLPTFLSSSDSPIANRNCNDGILREDGDV